MYEEPVSPFCACIRICRSFRAGVTGLVNYYCIKNELLLDANEKVELIVENSHYNIDRLATHIEGYAQFARKRFESTGFDDQNIRRILTQTLHNFPSIYRMAAAFEPHSAAEKNPVSPYYYKKVMI